MGCGLYEQNSTLRMNMERMDRLARHQLGAPVTNSRPSALAGPRRARVIMVRDDYVWLIS